MTQTVTLPKLGPEASVVDRVDLIIPYVSALSRERPWKVTFEEQKPTRTADQNALLWAIYTEILERGGEALGGWTKDDLHSFFLITHFGSETRELFGRKRLIPLKRSSKLNKQEFSDLIETIVRFMAERGIVIDMPEDMPDV